MTSIKQSRPGHWSDQHVNTGLAINEADERHDEARANRMFDVLKWATGVVFVFGCMLAGWYAK